MAQLTDELQPVERGKPIIETSARGDSPLATALSGVARGIDAFSSFARQRAETNAANARLAAQNNEKSAFSDAVSEVIGLNDAVTNYLPKVQRADTALNPQTAKDVTNPPMNLADAINDSIKAGKVIQRYQTAADQGTMPTISVAANVDRIYQELLAKHGPTAGQAIIQGLDAAGVKGFLVQGLKDQLSQHDAAIKRDQEWRDSAYKTGMTMTMGGQGMSEDQIIAVGADKLRNDNDLEMKLKQLQILQTQTNITEQERNRLKTDTSDAFLQHFQVDGANFFAGITPQIQKLAELANQGGPDAQANFIQMSTQIEGVIQNRINQTVAQAVASGSVNAQQAEQLRSNLAAQASGITSLYKGEASVVAANQKAFQNFSAVSGLSAAQALPVFTRLKNAGINANMIPEVMQGIATDPNLKTALQRELKGLSTTDPAGPVGQIALNNIVAMLKGNRTIEDHPMDEAVKLLPSLYNVSRAAAIDINNGGGDPHTFTNALGNVITAARSINGNTNIGANYTAAAGIVTAPIRAAMIKLTKDPATHDEGQALIMGSRAAAAVILGNMRRVSGGDFGYYNIQFNKQSGKFEAKLDQTRWAAVNKSSSASFLSAQRSEFANPFPRSNTAPAPQVPLAAVHAVDAANRSLDHLIETTKFDGDAPKGTPLELRKWYAADIPPASMKTGEGKKTPTNPVLAYQEAATALQEQLTHGPDMLKPVEIQNTPFDMVAPLIRKKESGGNYDAVVYGNSAPKNPTDMTLGEVYDFQKKELRPKTKGRRGDGDIGSTGIGAYQFESETLRSAAEEKFGANWKNIQFTPGVQDDLARIVHGHAKASGRLASTWAVFNGG